jgi:hypothetical protein
MTDSAPTSYPQVDLTRRRIRRQVEIGPLDVTPFRRECEVEDCYADANRQRTPEAALPYLYVCDNGHEVPAAAQFR